MFNPQAVNEAVASKLCPSKPIYSEYSKNTLPTASGTCFLQGSSPIEPIKGKRPIDSLIETFSSIAAIRRMLTSHARCGRHDWAIRCSEAILLDDDAGLRRLLTTPSENVNKK